MRQSSTDGLDTNSSVSVMVVPVMTAHYVPNVHDLAIVRMMQVNIELFACSSEIMQNLFKVVSHKPIASFTVALMSASENCSVWVTQSEDLKRLTVSCKKS